LYYISGISNLIRKTYLSRLVNGTLKQRNKESLKKAHHVKIENVAGLV
jgi:hypothetical protein